LAAIALLTVSVLGKVADLEAPYVNRLRIFLLYSFGYSSTVFLKR